MIYSIDKLAYKTHLLSLVPEKYAVPIAHMAEKVMSHRHRHHVRSAYLNGVAGFTDLGIAIPPSLRNIEVALGWCSRAVETVAQRSVFDGWSLPHGDIADFGIDVIIEENLLRQEDKRARASALTQGSVFQAVFRGDTDAGEPKVVIQSFSATDATGIYNPVTKKLAAGLLILEESNAVVNRFMAMFSDVIFDFTFDTDYKSWSVESYENELGEVPMVPLTFGATLDRPFGKSYISREMMNLADSAMRTVARTEVGAEFFITPQRYLLGADPEQFLDENGKPLPAWDLTMGRILALGPNADGQIPDVGTFDTMNPTSSINLLDSYAAQFAAAAKLPLSALGVEHANPASAEGVHAVREDLYRLVEDANADFGIAHKRVMNLAVRLYNDLDETPDELKSLTVNWRNPATPSAASSADAMMKLVAAGIVPADSDVAMRRSGLTDAEALEIKAYREKHGAVDRLAALVGGLDKKTPSLQQISGSPIAEG